MENLSPEQVEYWEDNETDKPKEQGKDETETTASALEGNSQAETRDKPDLDTRTEERSPAKEKPKFNARYYSKFGEFLHDPPRWDYLDAVYGQGTSHQATAAGQSKEPRQADRGPTEELANSHEPNQTPHKGQMTHTETAEPEEKPMQWEDVVDDPGEWDMCQ